jgi:hypothetical protein
MDMLVQYTPVAELSEDQKKRLNTTPLSSVKSGFVTIDGKVVSVSELRGTSQPSVKQNLFG